MTYGKEGHVFLKIDVTTEQYQALCMYARYYFGPMGNAKMMRYLIDWFGMTWADEVQKPEVQAFLASYEHAGKAATGSVRANDRAARRKTR